MFSKQNILDALGRDDLAELVKLFRLAGGKRTKETMIAALANTDEVTTTLLLEVLPLDSLRRACRALGLEDGGRSRATLVQRLQAEAVPLPPKVVRRTCQPAEPTAPEPRAPAAPEAIAARPTPTAIAVPPSAEPPAAVVTGVPASQPPPAAKKPGFILVRKSERDAWLAQSATDASGVRAPEPPAHPARPVVSHSGTDLFRQAATAALQEWQNRRGGAEPAA